MARKVAAGNWKMNGVSAQLDEATAIAAVAHGDTTVILCPPATLISQMVDRLASTHVQIGGQDCHPATSGAHTGDVSAQMLADAGARCVILGHSERRADHLETDELISQKVQSAWANELVSIICVGETEDERDAGQTIDVVSAQLAGSVPAGATGDNTIIAYEPVWAIGTGRTASPEEIAEVHSEIRAKLSAAFGEETANNISILYGGSVKPANAAEIFAVENVDGALVGGASLKAEDFGPIITALDRS